MRQKHTKRPSEHKQKRRRTPPHGRQNAAKGNQLILFGRHAVEAALRNPKRTIHCVYAAARYEAFIQERRAQCTFKVSNADEIGGLVPPGAVHQDICAHVAPLEQPALETLLAAARDGPIVVLDQVTDPHNVGAIFRSSAAFGAAAIIMQDKHAPQETGTLARAASGALECVPWVRVVNLARALETLGQAGYWSIGLAGAASTTLQEAVQGSGKVCLVFGAEGAGLRQNIEKHCDTLAKLDIDPQMESLNVSNAAAVALYITKQAARR
jgi:23S rRNA (guanosine2251-2'-O)-methyltransferase